MSPSMSPSMSPPMHAGPIAPRAIAGGFVLVPAREVLRAWRACRRGPLGVGDFRTWLASREMLARRCTLDPGRPPSFGFGELAGLTGVSEKRSRASVGRLVGAGLLAWSDQAIGFPGPGPGSGSDPADDTLADSIGGGDGPLAIPRRVLRLLARGARPALIATALAILLRCLSRGRGGFKARGRVKASWIARAFGVDLRRVKQARKELIDLGWIAPEEADRWAENRWGRAYTIDLGWDRAGTAAGRRLPPPPAGGGRRLPPPDSHPEPLRGVENQEPAPGGPAGVGIQGMGGGSSSSPDSHAAPAPVPPRPPSERGRESAPRRTAQVAGGRGASTGRVEPGRPASTRPAAVADGAGGGPPPPPTPRLDDVRVEDLEDTGRLLRLLDQAVARGLVGASEADRLRFVGAAEHAMAVGKGNPPGLFMSLVRGRLWRYLTQEDEGRANARIKRELRGEPPAWPGIGLMATGRRPSPSADALIVREVRAAMIRAGMFRDPFPEFRRLNPGWDRGRWDAAMAELRVAAPASIGGRSAAARGGSATPGGAATRPRPWS